MVLIMGDYMMISKLISDLSWNSAKQSQINAVKILTESNDFDIHLLIQPLDKSCWENAALVLKNKGVEKCLNVLDELFCTLQDMNWPGSLIICSFLDEFPKKVFLPAYIEAIKKAIKTDDDSWLANLSIYLYKGKVEKRDFDNQELYSLLKQQTIQWEKSTT